MPSLGYYRVPERISTAYTRLILMGVCMLEREAGVNLSSGTPVADAIQEERMTGRIAECFRVIEVSERHRRDVPASCRRATASFDAHQPVLRIEHVQRVWLTIATNAACLALPTVQHLHAHTGKTPNKLPSKPLAQGKGTQLGNS